MRLITAERDGYFGLRAKPAPCSRENPPVRETHVVEYLAQYFPEPWHWIAASLVAEARTNHLNLSELQIDFDCAESKLDGYRVWLTAIQRRVAPLPVTITSGFFLELVGM